MRKRRPVWGSFLFTVMTSACATQRVCETAAHERAQTAESSSGAPIMLADDATSSPPAATAATQEYPPEERFEPYPFVSESASTGSDTPDVSVHPWFFMGSLEKGEGDCDTNTTISFATVKDMGIHAYRAADPAMAPRCSHEVKRADTTRGPVVTWGATCTFEKDVVHRVSVRQIVIAEVPTQRGADDAWLHSAKYSESVSLDGEVGKACQYIGHVGRRAALDGTGAAADAQ